MVVVVMATPVNAYQFVPSLVFMQRHLAFSCRANIVLKCWRLPFFFVFKSIIAININDEGKRDSMNGENIKRSECKCDNRMIAAAVFAKKTVARVKNASICRLPLCDYNSKLMIPYIGSVCTFVFHPRVCACLRSPSSDHQPLATVNSCPLWFSLVRLPLTL